MIAGLWALTGFHQIARTMAKDVKGHTTYGLRRKMSMLVNSITSFSDRPLILIFYLGLVIGGGASCGGRLSRHAPAVLWRRASRVAVADRLDLDARRPDAHLPRHHRHLPVEGVHRDQATAVHDRPASSEHVAHSAPCLSDSQTVDATTMTGSAVRSDAARGRLELGRVAGAAIRPPAGGAGGQYGRGGPVAPRLRLWLWRAARRARARARRSDYRGFDISEAMIDAARTRHAGDDRATFTTEIGAVPAPITPWRAASSTSNSTTRWTSGAPT